MGWGGAKGGGAADKCSCVTTRLPPLLGLDFPDTNISLLANCFCLAQSFCLHLIWQLGSCAAWQLGSCAAGQLASWAAGQLDSWAAARLGTWAAGQLDSWAAVQLGSWAGGQLDSWAAGQVGSWTAGQLDSWAAGQLGEDPGPDRKKPQKERARIREIGLLYSFRRLSLSLSEDP